MDYIKISEDLKPFKLIFNADKRRKKEEAFLVHKKFKNNALKNGYYKNGSPVFPEYKSNSWGFRSNEFDNTNESFIALGDSNTYGAYQYENRTWPFYLSKLIKKQYFNLGVPGASIAQCYRILRDHIDKINPSEVFFLIPSLEREYTWIYDNFYPYDTANFGSKFSENPKMVARFPDSFNKLLDIMEMDKIMNVKNMELNLFKYLDAIENLCFTKNCKFRYIINPSANHRAHFITPEIMFDDSYAIDGRHAGHLYQERIAKYFFDKKDLQFNKLYAEKEFAQKYI